ncbi:hypothetical protein EAG_12397 [Camponotus floridanus]|uniref:Uncharacterized protein n=1 Tax=Camponotus floridanus TaxID=104421 RepID=E2AWD4_CAMFO|nr:hypothetical protein EAG_12397 [Camponotus floridanus]
MTTSTARSRRTARMRIRKLVPSRRCTVLPLTSTDVTERTTFRARMGIESPPEAPTPPAGVHLYSRTSRRTRNDDCVARCTEQADLHSSSSRIENPTDQLTERHPERSRVQEERLVVTQLVRDTRDNKSSRDKLPRQAATGTGSGNDQSRLAARKVRCPPRESWPDNKDGIVTLPRPRFLQHGHVFIVYKISPINKKLGAYKIMPNLLYFLATVKLSQHRKLLFIGSVSYKRIQTFESSTYRSPYFLCHVRIESTLLLLLYQTYFAFTAIVFRILAKLLGEGEDGGEKREADSIRPTWRKRVSVHAHGVVVIYFAASPVGRATVKAKNSQLLIFAEESELSSKRWASAPRRPDSPCVLGAPTSREFVKNSTDKQ